MVVRCPSPLLPLDHLTTPGTPANVWPLSNESGNQVPLGCTRHSCMVELGNKNALIPPGIISHPLTAWQHLIVDRNSGGSVREDHTCLAEINENSAITDCSCGQNGNLLMPKVNHLTTL